MRPNQNSSNNNKNRSRGRNSNNGGRKHVNPLSRNFESNGPDVKVRGNAAHIAEKYVQLARDAQASGDSVMAENYFQHAEHYFRILSAAQPQGVPRPDQFGQDMDGEEYDGDDQGNDGQEQYARLAPEPQAEAPRSEYSERNPDRGDARGERTERQGNDQRGDRQGNDQRGDRGDRQGNESRGERQGGEQRSEARADSRNEPRNEPRSEPRGDRPERAPRAERPRRERFQPAQEPMATAPLPSPVATLAPEAVNEAPAMMAEVPAPETEGEVKKPRRTRRRVARPEGADPAAEPQPDLGDLPAFITARGTASAAE